MPPEPAANPVVVPRRDRATVLTYVALLAITALAWIPVARSALQMDDMAGMAMAMTPSLSDGIGYTISWTVMMAAMMLPSALPMIGLYGATQRNAGPVVRAGAIAQFTLVYLALWGLTGVPIYLVSLALAALGPEALAYTLAAVLVAAGIFQVSPLKQVCLRKCRSPVGFMLGHWRPGWRGGIAMAWAHAVYCVGCCWALMVVLVVAGAMGLAWVLLIAVVVAAEKLLPRGELVARVTGAALVLLGLAVAIRPHLALVLRAGGHSM
jgi:predicted metal-binding membrane protein